MALWGSRADGHAGTTTRLPGWVVLALHQPALWFADDSYR